MIAPFPLCKFNGLIGCTIVLLLGGLLPARMAIADEDKAPPSGRSSGGRGCGLTAPASANVPALILFTPNQQRGQTSSTRPTFAWFVRDSVTRPLEFRLYEMDQGKFKLVKELKGDRFQSTPGITLLTLAPTDIALKVGQRYRWQVEIICDASRPSSNLFAQAEVEVVPLQAELQTQLTQQRDRVNQAQLYLRSNLWYDALTTVLPGSQLFAQFQSLKLSLIDRIAVNDTERKLLQNSPISSVQP